MIELDANNMEPDMPVKTKKPGGTFQSMGLSRLVLKAVERKGYKLATPIQRKCIPAIMSGRDLVAMARTGSGKSAAFLLPMIDRLKIRQPKADIRAIVLSPTRELAAQTFKFVREFSRYTNLVCKLIIGGESISKDFETITSAPDILVATPGRFAHVLVEMKRKLEGAEIVVFDEADRLFEPGFKEMEQVNEICRRLPDTRQTLLFSATMPQKLADFAKAGLNNPLLVRLDVESNLSETLKSIHLHCGVQDKFAILIYLLKNFVQSEQMTVVFMPTKHHVEYAKMLLDNTNIDCCHVYSSMDPEARRINIDRFVRKHCRVMLVTDIAARGIDIPLLDNVINFNFPFKPKLFIHRVGRVARAGRFGCAISLISHDETPYLHALHLFLDSSLTTAAQSESDIKPVMDLKNLPDKVLGTVPQAILDTENEIVNRWHEHNEELKSMVKVCENGMKPYLKTREPPVPFSVKAAKDIHRKVIGIHPLFKIISPDQSSANANGELNLLDRIKSYKPQATIFEVGHIKGNRKTEAFDVMQKKRQFHDRIAQKITKKDEEDGDEFGDESTNESGRLGEVKAPVVLLNKSFEDSKFYLKYQPDDYVKEKGLELDKSEFNNNLKRATFDLVADDENQLKRQRHQTIWDRKKKKYVNASSLDEQAPKKIRTESGALISASYSSGLYDKWKSKSKVEQRHSDDEDGQDQGRRDTSRTHGNRRRGKDGPPMSIERLHDKLKLPKRRRELKSTEEIFKERGIREKRDAILRLKTMKKAQRNAQKGPSKGPQKGSTKGPSKSSKRAPQRGANKGGPSKGGVSKGFKKNPQRGPPKSSSQKGNGRRRKS